MVDYVIRRSVGSSTAPAEEIGRIPAIGVAASGFAYGFRDATPDQGELYFYSVDVEQAGMVINGAGPAIGTPDPDMGEVILAVIEPSRADVDRDALVDQLRAHCAEHLPSIRQPKHYDVVDAMPRHPNGKLRKVEMRDHYRKIRGAP